MGLNNELSRRATIRLAGASASAALLAGCLDSYDADAPADDTDPGGTGDDEEDDSDDATDAEDDESDGADAADADDPTEILLEARISGWVGVEPAPIVGVENPTLDLAAGDTYRLDWVQGDGQTHNLQLVDADGRVVDDLRTPLTSDPEAESEPLEFTATDELAGYHCDPHANTMRGAIEVGSESFSDDADGDEDATDDDGTEDDAPEFEIAPGTRVELVGEIAGWVGEAPRKIEDRENPTLVLREGEPYAIGWVDGDGAPHNVEIRDDDGEVVDDLQTDIVTEPDGDESVLEFTASDAMRRYVCRPHETTMRGEIVVRSD
ncbi:plastocyanin/azurin family copper-binding protein [Halosolutus amylolyticus]|uniref:Plastocyanin/azurin family copper-binding protein n=1 Tax=Halosolutus amylolyticus TaxID=2932267 RepID=A0ABD5PJU0_9EURY|nr:plastocyanin/azurin family copper-binding protein [Halosolutus amylolyticus]